MARPGLAALDANHRRLLAGRNRYAIEQLQAAASIGADIAGVRGGSRRRRAARRPAARGGNPPDFTTAQRLDQPIPPSLTASDAFFDVSLQQGAGRSTTISKRLAEARDALPTFRLENVSITFNIDATYDVVRTQLTHNVVGIVEGSDPQLKNTYVAFGAHYDHVGYAEGETRRLVAASARAA